MAVPKRKKSKSKTRSRRAENDKVLLTKTVVCPNCGEYTRPHYVCIHCGYYKEKEVISQTEE